MKTILVLTLLIAFAGAAFGQEKPIVIETKNTALVYKSGMQNKLAKNWPTPEITT